MSPQPFTPNDNCAIDSITPAIWIGYFALCLGMFMAILDIQIVASSLPDIQLALHFPRHQLSWIQTAYLIAEVVAIPLTGWLTRLLSLRGLFMTAAGGFTLASIGCAASMHLGMLLCFRIFQGFFGGALIPIVFTAVFILFPPRAHVLATTIGGVMAVLAPTIGPVLGGYITENYSWHWLFLINVAPGILVIILASLFLRRDLLDWKLLRRLDYVTLLLIIFCLASLELLLKEGPNHNWRGFFIVALLIACPFSGALAIRRCLIHPEPIIDLRCFRDGRFNVACFYSFILGIGLYGSVYILPLYLAFVRQHTPLEIGEIMIAMGAAQLAVAPFAAVAQKYVNPLLLALTGYSLFAAGLISNGFMTYETDAAGLLWPQILRGAATLLCLLPVTSLALEGQPPELVANASGLFNLMRALGGAVGLALIDTVLEQRVPSHASRLAERLQAGDPAAALIVGLPVAHFHNVPMEPIDASTRAIVVALVNRAALVQSFNEAWLMLGALLLAALAALPAMGWLISRHVTRHGRSMP